MAVNKIKFRVKGVMFGENRSAKQTLSHDHSRPERERVKYNTHHRRTALNNHSRERVESRLRRQK